VKLSRQYYLAKILSFIGLHCSEWMRLATADKRTILLLALIIILPAKEQVN
jgi:hypothetical protein